MYWKKMNLVDTYLGLLLISSNGFTELEIDLTRFHKELGKMMEQAWRYETENLERRRSD